SRDRGDQSLLAVRNRAKTRDAINVRSTIISASFSSVNCHAHTYRHVRRPRLCAQRALNLERRCDRISRVGEDCEYTIAFATLKNECTVIRFDFAGHNLVMPLQCLLSFRRMRFPRARRSFHIREQECNSPNRPIRHWRKLWKLRNRRATSTFFFAPSSIPDAQHRAPAERKLFSRTSHSDVATAISALVTRRCETRSLPTLPRCYPRSFTFYLGNPISSIQPTGTTGPGASIGR